MPTRAPPMMKQTTAPMKKPIGHHLLSLDGRGAPGAVDMIENSSWAEKFIQVPEEEKLNERKWETSD